MQSPRSAKPAPGPAASLELDRLRVDVMDMLARFGYEPLRIPQLEATVPCALEALGRKRVRASGVDLSLPLDPLMSLQQCWDDLPQQRRRLPVRWAYDATAFATDETGVTDRRVLGAALIAAQPNEGRAEALLVALEALRHLTPGGLADVTLRIGDLGITRDLIARRGFGFRATQLLEENISALRDVARLGTLREYLRNEGIGHPGTERFYEQYRELVGKTSDSQVIGVFRGLLASMDIESYDPGMDLQALVERLLGKARFQRDCRDAQSFITLLADSAASLRFDFENPEPARAFLKENGSPASADALAQLLGLAEEAAELDGGEGLRIEIDLLPDSNSRYYHGLRASFLAGDGTLLGDVGEPAWLPTQAGGKAESPACFAFHIELDELAKIVSAQPVREGAGSNGPTVLVVGVGEDTQRYAREAWNRLYWDLPVGRVLLESSGRTLKKAMQAAVAAKCTHVALLGANEREAGAVTLKRLSDGAQQTFEWETPELMDFLLPDGLHGERLYLTMPADAAAREEARKEAQAAEDDQPGAGKNEDVP